MTTLIKAGVTEQQIDALVRKGALDRYQVTSSAGSVENRFKLHRDWRTLRI